MKIKKINKRLITKDSLFRERFLVMLEDKESIEIFSIAEQKEDTELLRNNLEAKLDDFSVFFEKEIKSKLKIFFSETLRTVNNLRLTNTNSKAIEEIKSGIEEIKTALEIKVSGEIPLSVTSSVEIKRHFIEELSSISGTISHLLGSNFSVLFGKLMLINQKTNYLQQTYNEKIAPNVSIFFLFSDEYNFKQKAILENHIDIKDLHFLSEICPNNCPINKEINQINHLINRLLEKDCTLNMLPESNLHSINIKLEKGLTMAKTSRTGLKSNLEVATEETMDKIKTVLDIRKLHTIKAAYQIISEIDFSDKDLVEKLNSNEKQAVNKIVDDYEKTKLALPEEELNDAIDRISAFDKIMDKLPDSEKDKLKEYYPNIIKFTEAVAA